MVYDVYRRHVKGRRRMLLLILFPGLRATLIVGSEVTDTRVVLWTDTYSSGSHGLWLSR